MARSYAVTPETIGLLRDALVREGQRVTCPRCQRELDPWPLGHRSCAPKHWAKCIATGVRTIEAEPIPEGAGICSRCSEPCDTVKDDDYGQVSVCCGWPLLPLGWTPPALKPCGDAHITLTRNPLPDIFGKDDA